MKQRVDQLTVTRFIVILLVLYTHGDGGVYLTFLKQIPFFTELLLAGPSGVCYFYVLSGFVMGLAYYRPHEKFNITGFWRARFLRLYPLYLIAFLITCAYYADNILRIKPQKILANIFIVQSWIPAYSQSFNYVAWSMTVEIFFYIIFPFFVIWAYRQSTKKLITVSIILWVISQVVYHIVWIGYFPERKDFIVYSPIFHLNSFVMGVVGSIWYLRERKQQNLKPITIFVTLSVSILLVCVYTIISLRYKVNFPYLPTDLQPMAGLLAPLFVLFCISLSLDKSRLSTFLSHPAFLSLGEATYAIYILHVPITWFYHRFLESSNFIDDSTKVFNLTAFPMLIMLGLFFRNYVDQPIQIWLKKNIHRINFPLLFLDLLVAIASIYLSFRLRFEHAREFTSYQSMMRILFYCAFFIRPALSIYFNTYNLSLYSSFKEMIQPIVVSTTLSSVVLFSLIYFGFTAGVFENFPRSIFISDWLIVLSTSVLTRFVFNLIANRKHRTLATT